MQALATNSRIGDLIEELADGKLKPDPDFQRRLVWSNKDKASFIQTILDNYPFPEIFIAKGEVDTKSGKSTIWLVDGQQRVTTINEYFSGSNKLPGIPQYEDLSEKDKKHFLNYSVAVRDLGTVTLEEVKEVFRRINATSYNLNPMEINNAFYNGPLKQLADEFVRLDFFAEKPIFTPNDVRRMQDTLYMLNIIITCMSDYYASNSQVEPFLEKYNNSFPRSNEYHEEIISVLDHIETMDFGHKSRAWNKGDFFTLTIELHRHLYKENLALSLKKATKEIKNFYSEVDEASKITRSKGKEHGRDLGDAGEYYNAASQATTSKKSRTTRGALIQKMLQKSS